MTAEFATDQDVDEYIGAKIRERRLARGLTQAELAGALGVIRSSVANIEAGRQTLSAQRLAITAAMLGADLGDFLPPVKLPAAPHSVTVRTVFVATCETCGSDVGEFPRRKGADEARREHIEKMREADSS